MTTTEFRLFITSAILMMITMSMLLSVMYGVLDADTVRTPMMVTGMAGVITFAIMRAMEWFRTKIVF